jgi:tripartite-type tricarboxylate transporter receptor subunit TctC
VAVFADSKMSRDDSRPEEVTKMRGKIRNRMMPESNVTTRLARKRILCRKGLSVVIAILAVLVWVHGIGAQEFPTKTITLLVGNPPGAGTDVCSRMVAQGARKFLGQEITPVNKPGGGGAVAAGILANSKGDGYTLLAVSSPCLTCTPYLETVPYDPFKDFVPIIQFGSFKTGIIVRSDSPFKSFKDLVEFARKNPGKVSYGIPGIGVTTHLVMESLMFDEKVNIAIVPFDGAVPAVTALLGGHISSCGISTSGFKPHLKTGKVRVLVATQDKRIEDLPDVPAITELGYARSAFTEVYVILAPKGTPPAVAKALEDAFRKSMETPEYRALATGFDMYTENPLSGQKLKDHLQMGYVKNGEIIQKANLGKSK